MSSEISLKCPCFPQCPNYGKCRECISAHAEYYTVPKCIKLMQEEMRVKHYHSSNPHIKKPLSQRIAEYYSENPDAHLRSVSEALKITDWQLLDALPTAVSVPVEDFNEIFARLAEAEKVRLHIDSGSAVFQLTTRLPKGIDSNGAKVIQKSDGETDITALVFAQSFYAVFLVREVLCGGKESLSAAFVNDDEKIAFSVYMCRSAEGIIEAKSKELFEALWSKYYKT